MHQLTTYQEGKDHVLYQEQFLPVPLAEVWEFFSDARNLEAITPSSLRFQILTEGLIEMAVGTEILYRIRLRGLPMKWRTEIAEWDPPHRFADNQLNGPYSLWYHRHWFEAVPGGTSCHDQVRYRLPFGPLGRLVHGLFVEREVQGIFRHRQTALAERFGLQEVSSAGSLSRKAALGGT